MMTIQNYTNDLINEYLVCQQYNHGDLLNVRKRMETTKEVLELWRDYEGAHLKGSSADLIDWAEHNTRTIQCVDLQVLIGDLGEVLG